MDDHSGDDPPNLQIATGPAMKLKLVYDEISSPAGAWVNDEVISVYIGEVGPTVTISTGKGRKALAIDDGGEFPEVFFIGCNEFDFEPPAEEE
jgi:hypothetical protein